MGKASAKVLKTSVNVPLVFALSIIADSDILAYPILEHRGPTHSLIIALAVFVPFFAIYRAQALPYFLALIQHPLVGDYLSGGHMQLFWPITKQQFGIELSILSPTNMALEWIAFLTAMALMVESKDVIKLFQSKKSNLLLTIPTITLILPLIRNYPVRIPVWLLPPHLIYGTIFSASVIVTLLTAIRKALKRTNGSISANG